MTTQAVTAVIGNSSESYKFDATATDGTFTGLTSENGGAALGVLLSGATMTWVMGQYTEGCGMWRIRDTISNRIIAQNFMTASGYSWMPDSSMIAPVRIAPTHALEVYTQPKDSTSNQSNVLALVYTNQGSELFEGLNVADSTDTSITTAIQGQSLGSAMFGSTINRIEIQEQDAGSLARMQILNDNSGTQYIAFGNQRGVTAGQQDLAVNFVATNLNIRVGKAFALQVRTTDN